jgi:hypothetical protein
LSLCLCFDYYLLVTSGLNGNADGGGGDSDGTYRSNDEPTLPMSGGVGVRTGAPGQDLFSPADRIDRELSKELIVNGNNSFVFQIDFF